MPIRAFNVCSHCKNGTLPMTKDKSLYFPPDVSLGFTWCPTRFGRHYLSLTVLHLSRPWVLSYPVTFLWHDDEELSQSDTQLSHFSGVRAAAISQAFHQGDVGPHFGHHTGILHSAWVAISVPVLDLQLRFSVEIPQMLV